jgi:drug/metabolite transporter (DMT)-like permease
MTAPPLSRHDQARVLVPFAPVTLVWGSTWMVICGQLGVVPATWSVAYRFASGSAAMFVYCLFKGTPLSIGRRGQGLAILMGFSMFILNFNLVYRAEQHITSGLVALVFALLVIPNALFAWFFFDQQLSRRFVIRSAVAITGLVILFLHELVSAGGLLAEANLATGSPIRCSL